MPCNRKLYDVLGVEPTATEAEIKRAAKRRAKETHPDLNGADPAATTHLCDVIHAKVILLDPAKRARYDETGDETEGSPSDSVETEALELISRALARFLLAERPDVFTLDWVNDLVRHFQAARVEPSESLRVLTLAKLRAGRAVGHFKAKGAERRNVLASMMRYHERRLCGSIAEVEHRLAVLDRAIEIVSGHEFESSRSNVSGGLWG